MTCDEIAPLLSAYVDGELNEASREAVQRHLASCPVCAREWRELRETMVLLGQLDEADPPATLGPGLRRRIRRRAAGILVAALLLLVAILPTAQLVGVVLRPDLPLWARAGFAFSAVCLSAALLLLIVHLLRHLRSLILYSYLSGGGTGALGATRATDTAQPDGLQLSVGRAAMRFGYTGSATIRVFWLLLLLGATGALLTSLALGLIGQPYHGLSLPLAPHDQIVMALTLVAMWLVLGTPFLTTHEVRDRDVVLRQGLLFAARLPYAEIEAVGYSSRRPIGIGVRWYPDNLFVITWPANLVEIRLRRRHVFRIFGIIPLPPVRAITVNVDDPDRFLSALRAHLHENNVPGRP